MSYPAPESENNESTHETKKQPNHASKLIYAGLIALISIVTAVFLSGDTTSASEVVVNKGVELIEPESPMPKPEPEVTLPETPVTPMPESPVVKNMKLKSSTWSGDYAVMLQNVHLYDELHPFIYSLKGKKHNEAALVSSWGHKKKLERIAELRKRNPNVKIIPTIFRWENPGEKINEVIGMNGRNDIRDKHIENIVQETVKYGYDGIDIDYEGMHCSKKEKFEEFIVKLSGELKKQNKLLSVAVHPKTPAEKGAKGKFKTMKCSALKNKVTLDFRENWRGPQTHDYKFLAKYADMVKIMAYELHPRRYKNPGPGPQAPGKWLQSIIEYASDKVPAEKLYMAIPTYGYDWGLNCRAAVKSVYYSDVKRIKRGMHTVSQPTDINAILKSSKSSRNWSNLRKFKKVHQGKVYEDPALWYSSGGCQRVAFFMNKKAFAEKMNILQKNQLAGFSFWQLTADNDPEIHAYLAEKLNKGTTVKQ